MPYKSATQDPILNTFLQGVNAFTGEAIQGPLQSKVKFNTPLIGMEDFSSKYDHYYRPTQDMMAMRARAQGAFAKLANGLVSRGLSIVPKTLQMIGHIGGFADAIASGGDWEKIWDNAFVNAMSNADEGLREWLPVYKGAKYRDGNFIRKMTTPEFWFDDVFDGVAFLISGGYGVGRGTKLLMDAVKAGTQATRWTATGLSAVGEAGFEAKEVRNHLFEEYLHAINPKTGKTYTPEEARMLASTSAARVFTANLAALAFPNYVEMGWFGLKAPKLSREFRKSVRAGNDISKEISKRSNLFRNIAGGVLTEGFWEENVQNAIQGYESSLIGNTHAGLGDQLKHYGLSMVQNAAGFLKGFSPFHEAPAPGSAEDQGATAILLGGLLGGAGGAFSTFRERSALRGLADDVKQRWDMISVLNEVAKKAFIGNVVVPLQPQGTEEIKDENGEPTGQTRTLYRNPKTGTPALSAQGMLKTLMYGAQSSVFTDHAMLAAAKGDPVYAEYHRNMALAAYAWHLRSIPNLSEEEVEDLMDLQLGIKDIEEKTDLKGYAELENAKSEIKSLLDMYDETVDRLTDISDYTGDEVDNDFKSMMRRVGYYAAVKAKAAEAAAEKTQNPEAKSALELIAKENNEFLDDIAQPKMREKYKTIFEEQVMFGRDLEAKIAEIEEKLNETEDAEEAASLRDKKDELNYELTMLKDLYNYFYDTVFTDTSYFSASAPTVEARNYATQPYSRVEKQYYHLGLKSLFEMELMEDIEQATDIQHISEIIHKVKSNKSLGKLSEDVEAALRSKLATIKDEYKDVEGKKENAREAAKHFNTVFSSKQIFESMQEDSPYEYIQNNPQAAKSMRDYVAAKEGKVPTDEELVLNSHEYAKQATKEEHEYANVLSYLESVEEDMVNLPEEKFKEKTPDQLHMEFLDDYLVEHTGKAYDAYLANPENFTMSTSQELATIAMLRRYYKDHKLQDKVYKRLDAIEAVLKEAATAAEANRARRYANQKDAEAKTLESLREMVDDTVLTKEQLDKIDKDSIFSYFAALNELKSDDPTREKILKQVSEKIRAELQAIDDKLIELNPAARSKRGIQIYASPMGLPYMMENPVKIIYFEVKALFEDRINAPIEGGKITPMQRYNISHDFPQLMRDLEVNGFKDFTKEEVEILKQLQRAYELGRVYKRISNILESEYDLAEIVKAQRTIMHEKSQKGEMLYPTSQQHLALLDIVLNVLSGDNFFNNANLTVLQGIFGSGKSSVVASTVKEILIRIGAFKQEEIAAIGHTQDSTNVISTSLGVPVAETLEGKKLLFIDELFGFTNDTLNGILQIAGEAKIKVIGLGDPSQIRVEEELSIETLAHPKTIYAEPITVILRTNESSIANLSVDFQYNPVEQTTVYVSTPVQKGQANSPTTKGVMMGGEAQMIEAIKANTGRSKKLIVNNESEVARFSQLLSGVPNLVITTYVHAQGTESQEVYVALDKAKPRFDGAGFPSPLNFNTAMATSISRAKEMVFVMNTPSLTFIPQATGSETQSETLEKEFAAFQKDYLDALEAYDNTFEAFGKSLNLNVKELIDTINAKEQEAASDPNDNVDDVTETAKTEKEPDVTDAGTDTTAPSNKEKKAAELNVFDVPKVEVNEEGSFILLYPQNEHLHSENRRKQFPDKPMVHPGANAFVIKAIVQGREQWVWLAETDEQNVYAPVGVVSKEDTAKNPQLQHIISNASKTSGPGSAYTRLNNLDSQVVKLSNVQPYIISNQFTVKEAQPLAITYSPNNPIKSNVIHEIVYKLLKALGLDNMIVDDVINNHTDLHVYTHKEKKSANIQGVKVGMLYLRVKVPGTNTLFHIKLQPPRLRTFGNDATALRNMQKDFTELAELLGENPDQFFNSDRFTHLLSRFSDVVEYDPVTKGPVVTNKQAHSEILQTLQQEILKKNPTADFTNLDNLLTRNFLHFYGVQKRAVLLTEADFKKQQAVNPEMYAEWKKINSDKTELGYVYSRVEAGEDKKSTQLVTLKEEQYTANQGPASQAWRRIGKANTHVGTYNLRYEKPVWKSGKKTRSTEVHIKTLLGSAYSYTRVYDVVKDAISNIQNRMMEHISMNEENLTSEQIEDLKVLYEVLDLQKRIKRDKNASTTKYGEDEMPPGLVNLLKVFQDIATKLDLGDTPTWEYKSFEEYMKEFEEFVTKPVPLSAVDEITNPTNYGMDGFHSGSVTGRGLFTQVTRHVKKTGQKPAIKIDGYEVSSSKTEDPEGVRNFENLGVTSNMSDVKPTHVKLVPSNAAETKVAARTGPVEESAEVKAKRQKLINNGMDPDIANNIRVENLDSFIDDLNNSEFFISQATVFPFTNPGKEISKEEAIQILQRVFPGISVDNPKGLLTFINQAALSELVEGKYDILGRIRSGVMELQTTEVGSVYEKVVYHELFHYAMMLMPKSEQAKLIRAVQKAYPAKVTQENASEALAELYQQRVGNPERIRTYRIKQFFNWIGSFFNIVLFSKTYLESAYRRVDAGVYTATEPVLSDNAPIRNMQYVLDNFGSVQAYRNVESFLRSTVKKYVTPITEDIERLRNNEIPLTLEEIFLKIKDLSYEKYMIYKTQYEDLKQKLRDPNLTEEQERTLSKNFFNAAELYRAYDALTSINTQTNKLILSEMMEEIFPSVSSNLLDAFIQENSTLDIDDNEFISEDSDVVQDENSTIEDNKGINKEAEDSATTNWEKSQTLAVKNFLAFVPLLNAEDVRKGIVDSETNQLLNPSLAYRLMLRLIVDIGSLNMSTAQIRRTLKGIQKNTAQNVYSLSMLRHFEKLLDRKSQKPDYSNGRYIVAKTTEFSSYPVYHIVETTTPSDTLLSLEEFQADPNAKISKGYKSLRELYENSNMTYNEFISKYEYHEALSQFTELQSYLGSLKETEYYIAQLNRNFKKGFNSAFIKAKSLGESVNLQGQFVEFVNRIVNKEIDYGSVIDNAVSNNGVVQLLEEGNMTPFKQGIDKLVTLMGLPDSAKEGIAYEILRLDTPALVQMLKSIKYIPTEGSIVMRGGEEVLEYNQEGELVPQRANPIVEWSDDNSNYINILVKGLVFNSPKLRAESIISSTRKKIYKFHMSSYIYDTFNALMRPSDIDGEIYSNLRTTIYAGEERLSKVHSLGEIDGYKVNNFGKEYAKKWLRLNKSNFFNVTFLSAFLDMATTRQSDQRYFQPLYQQSNKPRPVGAVVDVMSTGEAIDPETNQRVGFNEIRRGIEKMYMYIASQPDISAFSKNYHHRNFTNATLLKNALTKFNVTLDDLISVDADYTPTIADQTLMDKLVTEVLHQLSVHALEVTRQMIEQEIPVSNNPNISKLLRQKTNIQSVLAFYNSQTESQVSEKDIGLPKSVYEYAADGTRTYQVSEASLFPLIDLYVKNHFVQGYFLTSEIAGTFDAYKGNDAEKAKDVIKRLSGANGPGAVGYNNPEDMGEKARTFKAVVVGDDAISYADAINMFARQFYGDPETWTEENKQEIDMLSKLFDLSGFDRTDAQSFITPTRARQLRRMYGRGYKMGSVTKPMYFGVRYEKDANGNTIPVQTYIKTSAIELSDDLLDSLPNSTLLRELRTAMERSGHDELIFGSAVKLGKPNSKLDLDTYVSQGAPSLNEMVLDNRYHRMQLNPRAKTDSEAALFTQLMYFLNVLGTNNEAAHKAYSAVSFLMETGLDAFKDKTSTAAKFKNFIKRSLGDSADEKIAQLLAGGVRPDNPILEQRAMIKVASGLEKLTTKIKLPGSKLVLQSDVRVKKKDGTDLEYKVDENGNLVAEMIVPRGLLDPSIESAIEKGIDVFGSADLLGWRIPSTELHSAAAIRVVGFYDSKGSNVVIAPALLVALHGSDFDVDSLFVVKRPTFTEDINIESIEGLEAVMNSLKGLKNVLTTFQSDTMPIEQQIAVKKLALILEKSIFNSGVDSNIKLETIRKYNTPAFQNQMNGLYKTFLNNYSLPNDEESRTKFGKTVGITWSPVKSEWQVASKLMFAVQQMMYEVQSDTEMVSNLPAEIMNAVQSYLNTQAAFIMGEHSSSFGKKGDYIGYEFKDGKAVESSKVDEVAVENIERINRLLEIADEMDIGIVKSMLKSTKNKLVNIRKDYARLVIINTMIDTITNPSNRNRMGKPIYKGKWSAQDPATGKYTDDAAFSILEKLGLYEETSPDLSLYGDTYTALKSVSDGAALTGIIANSIKALAYIVRSGETEAVAAAQKTLNKAIDRLNRLNKTLGEKYNTTVKELDETMMDEEDVAKVLEASEKIQKAREDISTAIRNTDLKGALPKLAGTQIMYDGVELDQMRETTIKDGTIIWDLLDSLVNVAIDNVKDMDLPRFNATIDNINSIIVLISLGMDAKDVVLFANQPIIKHIMEESQKPGKNVDSVIRSIRNRIDEQYEKVKGEPMGRTPIILSLDTQVKLAKQGSLEKTLEEADSLRDAVSLIRLFEVSMDLGNYIKDMSSFLSVLRELPVTFDRLEDIENTLESIGTISSEENLDSLFDDVAGSTLNDYNKSFADVDLEFGRPLSKAGNPISRTRFKIPLFLKQNPHIISAIRIMRSLKSTVANNMFIHSDFFRDFIDSMELPLRFNNSHSQNAKSEIRREAIRYLFTQSIPIDFKSVETYVSGTGDKSYRLYGVPAWQHNFTLKVKSLKDAERKLKASDPSYKPNLFLENLSVIPSGNKFKIKFAQSTELSPADLEAIEKDFDRLKYMTMETEMMSHSFKYDYSKPRDHISDIQREFVYYAILTFGLNYSYSNYGRVLPTRMYLEQQDALYKIFDELRTSPKFQETVRQHLFLELLRENADKITTYINKNVVGKPEGTTSTKEVILDDGGVESVEETDYSGKYVDEEAGKTIYYNRKYKNPTEVKADRTEDDVNFPRVFASGSGRNKSIFMRINTPMDDYVYYQRVAVSTGVYEKIPSVEYNYDRFKAFDPSVFTLLVKSVSDIKVLTNKDLSAFVESGEHIRLVAYSDMTRVNAKYVQVLGQDPDSNAYIMGPAIDESTILEGPHDNALIPDTAYIYIVKLTNGDEIDVIYNYITDKVVDTKSDIIPKDVTLDELKQWAEANNVVITNLDNPIQC